MTISVIVTGTWIYFQHTCFGPSGTEMLSLGSGRLKNQKLELTGFTDKIYYSENSFYLKSVYKC